MRIRVYAPAYSDHGAIDENGFMDVPEGSTLSDIYRKLKIRPLLRPLVLCAVNYKVERPSFRLSDGDVVSFISFLIGG